MDNSVGSLFAGIGGICLGFKQAGFSLEWANEIDKFACVTYRNNFHHTLIEDDIYNIDVNNLSKVDILTAGFPCQAFSIAGEQKGFNDSRGRLFFEIIRILNVIRPKVLFLENVKNLKSHDKGNTLKTIKQNILDSGYTFTYFVLNTAKYGNLPQNRERIYVVCFDKELPKINKITDSELLEALVPQTENLTVTVKDLLSSDKQDAIYYYDNSKYYSMLKDSITKSDTIYQLRRNYVRENKNNLCPALIANMGTGGHNVPLIKDDYGIRKLTPRECFRFQGFPEKFRIPNITKNYIYKQLGNSVSVPVIKKIAHNIKMILTDV